MRKNVVALLLILAFVAAGAAATSTAHADLVVNGEFGTSAVATLTGWTPEGTWIDSYDYVDTAANYTVLGIAPPGNVLSLSNYQYEGSAGISQTLSTAVGQQYSISLFWGETAGDGNNPGYQFINILWNGVQVGSLYSANASNWALYTSPIVTGTGSDVLEIDGLDNSGHTFVADVSVTPSAVPIPGAFLLLGPGLAGIVTLRRRFQV